MGGAMKEAMKLALEASESIKDVLVKVNELISENKALKEALAKQEQGEPVVKESFTTEQEQGEIERLTDALKKANAQAEHFEREWYLRGDELEELKQEQGEPVGWPCVIETADFEEDIVTLKMQSKDYSVGVGLHWLSTTPQQRTWVGLTPLNIEDKYVRNYLWERALIAIDDPCCRSHPHENMNEYCQRRTELARHQAKLKEKNT
jgi:hypothetical protein